MADNKINSSKYNEIFAYLRDKSVRESAVLQELRNATINLNARHVMMMSPAEHVNLLANLIRIAKAKRVIEIGVYTGVATLAMAEALPADGKIIACDVSEEWTSIGRKYWEKAGLSDKIDLNLRSAVETLDELLANGHEQSFDFCFIDADKCSYDAYYEKCLKLVRQGGVIAIDNVLWSGRVMDDAAQDKDTVALRNLNNKIAADDRVFVSMLHISDGLTLAIKK